MGEVLHSILQFVRTWLAFLASFASFLLCSLASFSAFSSGVSSFAFFSLRAWTFFDFFGLFFLLLAAFLVSLAFLSFFPWNIEHEEVYLAHVDMCEIDLRYNIYRQQEQLQKNILPQPCGSFFSLPFWTCYCFPKTSMTTPMMRKMIPRLPRTGSSSWSHACPSRTPCPAPNIG